MHPFKRKKVDDMNYLYQLVCYIHNNPVKSRLTNSLTSWEYSSFKHLVSGNTTFLNVDEVIDWYGDKNNFIYVHSDNFEQDILSFE
jgi:putative transposase